MLFRSAQTFHRGGGGLVFAADPALIADFVEEAEQERVIRSEERRGGKECRSRWWRDH